MRKNILFPVIGALFFMAAICHGGEDYSEAIKVNREFHAAMEAYLNALDKADDAAAAAAAMNRFADDIEVVGPKMKEVIERHPELKDPETLPEEFDAVQEESKELNARFIGTFMKLAEYMKDPEVQKAQQRVSNAMNTMAK